MLRSVLVLVLGVMAAVQVAGDDDQDHYKVLEVPRSATQKEIRSAYKKLSLKYHPDKQSQSSAEAAATRFAQISSAYMVLGDPDKRDMYDNYGGQEFTDRQSAQRAGAQVSKGFYSNNEDVVELKRWMFNGWSFNGARANGPLSTKDKWVFEFYTPWCVHCQHMVPHFNKAARRMSEEVGFAAANCEEEKATCEIWNIYSYPTMFFVSQSERIQEKYTGDHSAEAIVDWVKEMSINAVDTLSPQSFEAKVWGSQKAFFVLFTAGSWCGPCTAAKPKFRRFGAQIFEHAGAGTVDCDAYGDFCSEMGVNGYPHYRSFAPGGERGGEQMFSPREVGAETALNLVSQTVKMMARASALSIDGDDADTDMDNAHDEL